MEVTFKLVLGAEYFVRTDQNIASNIVNCFVARIVLRYEYFSSEGNL